MGVDIPVRTCLGLSVERYLKVLLHRTRLPWLVVVGKSTGRMTGNVGSTGPDKTTGVWEDYSNVAEKVFEEKH